MYKGSRTWKLKQTKINDNIFYQTQVPTRDKNGVLRPRVVIDFDNIEKINKPPMGLRPRFIIDEERLKEVKSAIIRYLDAQILVPVEWLKEYNELIKKNK